MKIAYMHFHLNAGGVTTVIKKQVQAASQAGCKAAVICGRTPENRFPAKILVIPGLGYTLSEDNGASANEISEAVMQALYRVWPKGADLIHVHNPTLAKNRHLQSVLKNLQAGGNKILCQIHDFAEDGRPSALFPDEYLADCHYAVLNGRDFNILRRAGLADEGLHYLPNPVSALPSSTCPVFPGKSDQMVLYPIRAIRRKNIGEALLLSLFFSSDLELAITLPPTSPLDWRSYDAWRVFARQQGLPVRFEAGLKTDFTELLGNCRYVLTTSINEGFGYVFLEPWIYYKSLWGRLLPDVCNDFRKRGLKLDQLYRHLLVPLNWLDSATLKNRWQQAYRRAAALFNYQLSPEQCDTAWQRICADNRVDIGLMDENFQRLVITKIVSDPNAAKQLQRLNPFLRECGSWHSRNQVLIQHNRRAVLRFYNPERYADRLLGTYRRVMSVPVRHTINKKILHTAFLEPRRFSLLKWGMPDYA